MPPYEGPHSLMCTVEECLSLVDNQPEVYSSCIIYIRLRPYDECLFQIPRLPRITGDVILSLFFSSGKINDNRRVCFASLTSLRVSVIYQALR